MLNNRNPHSPPQHPITRVESPLDGSRTAPPQTGSALHPALPLPSAAPVSSATLLRGHKTVDIAHNGMLYTLQATKLGKLILTK
jgi:hemin uptake protein HemP